MEFDTFFSISQTPVGGELPSEQRMFRNFFSQVEVADALGFGVAWVAESHLSSEVQKRHPRPVIPHWEGEVGLNSDFCQLAAQVFRRTKRIHVGSAVMNILCMGGPVAAAERVAVAASFHGLDPEEQRRMQIGFAAGRFEFMNRASGIVPRDAVEEAAWPVLRGQQFREAAEIFVRLLRGDILSGDDIESTVLTPEMFRSEADWEALRRVAADVRGLAKLPDTIPFAPRFPFEVLQIVPRQWRRELVQLVVGSHDPDVQCFLNQLTPVQVFNLSITRAQVIDETHRRMEAAYHHSGGPWRRSYMPRTVMVFVNGNPQLSPEQQRRTAHEEAGAALSAYWRALEGTLDPKKVQDATNNAVIGNADDIATQILERFHRDDRLMLWFDFFNHDSARVIHNMETFMAEVAPRVRQALGDHRG